MAAQVNIGASAGVEAIAATVSFPGRNAGAAVINWVQPVSFLIANGEAQVEEQIELPGNALVDRYQVVVQALPAYSVPLSLVAQVRDSDDQGQKALVIDFGTMVTINGLQLPDPGIISGVKMWVGTQFSTKFVYPLTPGSGLSAGAGFTEIKTERLLVRYSDISVSKVLEEGLAYLADPPSGLELRIDDGPPVWSHPAVVRLGDDGTLSEAGWNDQAKRLVDLTAALRALAGDPLASDDMVTFKLTLSARLPCLLDLAKHGVPDIRRIRRVRIADSETIGVVATEEGRQSVALALPALAADATRLVTEVRLTAAGSFAPDRTLPPVGPPAALLEPAAAGSDAQIPVAELVIDAAHAVCFQLGAAAGLEELQGVRLPLAAGPGGCELRVTVRDTLSIDPAVKVVSQTSDPVTLEEGGEAWTSFAFKTAFALDPAALPWLVLTAARGEATLAVAAEGAIEGDPLAALVDDAHIRRGPPGGPWQALPWPLELSPREEGAIAARGRLRLVGLPPKAAPLPPLVLQLAGDAAAEPLTPNARGVPLTLIPDTQLAAANPILDVIAYAPGTLTLSAIDVITLE